MLIKDWAVWAVSTGNPRLELSRIGAAGYRVKTVEVPRYYDPITKSYKGTKVVVTGCDPYTLEVAKLKGWTIPVEKTA